MSFDERFPEYGTEHGVLRSPDPAVAVSSPLHVGSGTRRDDGAHRFAHRRQAARRDCRIGAAARQRLSECQRHRGARRARSRATARRTGRADAVACRVAHLDGLEHRRRVPRDRRGGRRGRESGAAHGLARLRAIHRSADPKVRDARAGRVCRDRSDSPRQLVSGLAARRTPRADRSGRWLRHEPDGSGVGQLVGPGGRGNRTRPRSQAAGARAGLVRRRAAGDVLAGEIRLPRGARSSCGPATIRAA